MLTDWNAFGCATLNKSQKFRTCKIKTQLFFTYLFCYIQTTRSGGLKSCLCTRVLRGRGERVLFVCFCLLVSSSVLLHSFICYMSRPAGQEAGLSGFQPVSGIFERGGERKERLLRWSWEGQPLLGPVNWKIFWQFVATFVGTGGYRYLLH